MNIITVIGNGFDLQLGLMASDGKISEGILNLIDKISSEDITNIIGSLAVLLAAIFAYKSVKKQIRGDVVAKSRIEWIQEVRKLTADLISAYFEWQVLIIQYRINKTNVSDIIPKSIEIQKKTQLLSLYFNAKPTEEISCKNYDDYRTNIYNKLINVDIVKKEPIETNARIVKMLVYILDDSLGYCNFEDELVQSDFFKNPESPENKLKKEEYDKRGKEIMCYCNELSEVMSVYLKIEWDKAKEGK
jgi:hypothetical protein